MSSTPYNGSWFLPGSNLRLPGRLLFDGDQKQIVLELISEKYIDNTPVVLQRSEEEAKKYHSKKMNHNHQTSHSLIQGNTNSDDCTLYNCLWSSTEYIGENLYTISYKANFVFFGLFIDSIDTFLFKSATLVFPYLSSWYDGEDSIDKMSTSDGANKVVANNFNTYDKTEPINIENRLKLIIYDDYTTQLKEVGISYVVSCQKMMEFNYQCPTSFNNILTDISKFTKLLEFSLGQL